MSNHGWVSSHSSPMNPAPLKVSSSSISRQQQSKFQIQWFNMYAINSFNYETRANKIYLFPYFRICSISWMNWISYTFFFYHLELPWDWPLTIELKFNFSNSQFSVHQKVQLFKFSVFCSSCYHLFALSSVIFRCAELVTVTLNQVRSFS